MHASFPRATAFGYVPADRLGSYVPHGYTRSAINGVPVTYLGRRVYDNGVNVIYL